MANNTVYPYGTGGQMPSGIPIVDDLTTGGADKALSAQQGVVLLDLINDDKHVEITMHTFRGQGTTGVSWTPKLVAGHHYQLRLSDTSWAVSQLGTNDYKFILGYNASGTSTYITRLKRDETVNEYYSFTAVQNDNYIFGFRGNTGVSVYYELTDLDGYDYVDVQFGYKTVIPEVEYGRLSDAGWFTEMLGSVGSTNVVYDNRYFKRTPQFISLVGVKKFKVSCSASLYILPIWYSKSFEWVGSGVDIEASSILYSSITANVEMELTTPEGAEYVRFCFGTASSGAQSTTTLGSFEFKVSGTFMPDCITKNPKSPDNDGYGYYQHIAVLVNTTNPNSTDTQTDNVQDTQSLVYDHGVLALPRTYSPFGKPTRLIIYCHGAGAAYTIVSRRFHSFDVNYWLSEGYAVMDIGGDPFTDNDVHGYVPQARQSYMAAYNWLIKNYNIYPDGIFLGGKSMGGGMTFELLNSTIPVIASCAVVPVCNYVWWWTYMNSTRRSYVATHLGFVGTAPSWTSNSPMSSAEWNYIKGNSDKWRMYDPFTRMIMNPPTVDEMFTGTNLSASTSLPTQDEEAIWAGRTAKAKAPIKIFVATDDTIVPPERNGKFMFTMLKNGGSIVEYRQFTSGGHYIDNVSSGGQAVDYVNSYGETIEDVPVVFVEALNFWRRYELLF